MKAVYLIMLKKLPYLLVIAITCYSCDCMQRKKGVIINKKTGKPIDSVYIHKIGEQQGEYSDASGNFEITAISGGVFGCPVLELGYNKSGYSLVSEGSMPSDTVYMVSNP